MKEDIGIIERFQSLDGIRGMAFLFVFINHTFVISEVWGKNLRGAGKIGVWLFFILSSFLLTYYFASKPEKTKSSIEWINYFVRRFFRIYPLYVIVILIYYFLHININDSTMLKQHLLLIQGVQHFWTMPVETRYYLLLPLIVLFLVYVLKNNPLMSLIFLIIFIGVHQYFIPSSKSIEGSVELMQYLPVFIMGSVSAILHIYLKKQVFPQSIKITFDVISILIFGGIIVSIPGIAYWLLNIPKSDYLVNKYIYFGIAWSIFVLCVLNGSGAIRKIYEIRLLRYIGNLSFPAYLIHWIFLDLSVRYIKVLNVYSISLMIFGTLGASIILNRLIERPLSHINLIKKSSYKNYDITEKGIL